MSKRARVEYTHHQLISDRQLGMRRKLGYDDDLHRRIYSNFDVDKLHTPLNKYRTGGGIFNLEFSLDGKLLVAACEEKSVLLYDAANQSCFYKIENAHTNCVNCVRFINKHLFATCSDDGTLKLWDTRHLQKPMRTMLGHANWVKNIEYSEKDKMLVTSAFDGSIFAWDLQLGSGDTYCHHQKVFEMNSLMRTKLTPDGTKMIIATTSGFIMIIHDLNLKTMHNDLLSFKPNLYRLMQLSGQIFPQALSYNHLFSPNTQRNRIEFIDDFPNDAEIISSVQIHPMGWNAISRNICSDDSQEWTCVHDIQKRESKELEYVTIDELALPDTEDNDDDEDDESARQRRIISDIWIGSMSNDQFNIERNREEPTELTNRSGRVGIISSGILCDNFQNICSQPCRIVQNSPRLTHYIEEITGCGKGYIKELCYSSDGRLICSPYGKGVRLLSFNDQLQEVCYCVPEHPQELSTVATYKDYHKDVVLCCKFNPMHYQMVSGCLSGGIVWYKPIL